MGETLNVLFYASGDGTYELRVKESWSGRTVKGPFIPPYTARQINALQKKLGAFNSRDSELRATGRRLFAALCGAELSRGRETRPADLGLQSIFLNVIQRTLRRRGTVALMLEFGAGCEEFMRYPWELLHNGDHFLLVSGVFTLSRVLVRPDLPVGCELPVQPPFRVLYIAASPADCPPLETERSFDAMQLGLAPLVDSGQVLIDRLEPPTFGQLVRYLNLYGGAGVLRDENTSFPCYVIHFDGHGAYGRLCPKDGCETVNEPDVHTCQECGTSLSHVKPQTYLCFCDDEGMNRFIDTASLRDLLLSSDVRLAVFSACETARLSGEQISASEAAGHSAVDTTLATALVTAQVPAVIAMPFSLQDDLSPTFMFHFYEALAEGRTLEEGLSRARQAMLPMQQKSWFIPVLYRHVAEEEEAPVPLLVADDTVNTDHPLRHLVPASSFIGRAQELLDLDEILTSAATGQQRSDLAERLGIASSYAYHLHHFAITGPAGIGKSSLAYEAIRRNRNKFPGGIVGISLQQGKSFADAIIEIGRCLRLHTPTRNVTVDVMQRLVEVTLRSLASRELPCLLLLDSFEEVTDRGELDLWFQFLCHLPREVVVLVTSHINPGNVMVSGGLSCRWYEYRLGKMAHEDLFTLLLMLAEESGLDQRIHLDHSAQLAILHEICSLLDGYPLGAELIFGATRMIDGKRYTPEAATRSLEEVRDDLRNTPLAGMMAVLEISYRRLSPPARILLAYLAAFKLPFDREQIRMLIASIPQHMAWDQVEEGEEKISYIHLVKNWRTARDELVQASFILFDGQRYQLHSQVRNFALAYLPLEERRRVHRVIAAYYSSLPNSQAEEWFAAFEHLEIAGEPDDQRNAIRTAVQAARALSGRGQMQDVLAILRRAALYASHLEDQAIPPSPGVHQGNLSASVDFALGMILRQTEQYAEAEAYLRNALAIYRQQDDSRETAWTMLELAKLFNERGESSQASDYACEAETSFQALHDPAGEAWALFLQGEVCRSQDCYDEALEYFSRAFETFQTVQDPKGRASVLLSRGLVSVAQGRYTQALHDYDEALCLFAELELLVGCAWVLASLGAAYLALLQDPANRPSPQKQEMVLPIGPALQSSVVSVIKVNTSVDPSAEKMQQAESACREALAMFEEQGLQRGQAWSLRLLGDIARLRQDSSLAHEQYKNARSLLRAEGNQVDLARIYLSLGSLLFDQEEYLEAKGLYEQASVMTDERGARRLYGLALRGRGDVAVVLRQYHEAERYYREAKTVALELGASNEQSLLLLRLGMLGEERKQYHMALDYWVQALTLNPHLSYPSYADLQQRVDTLVAEHHLEEIYHELCTRHSLV